MTQLESLLPRLREAKEGSQNLDAGIICALLAPEGAVVQQSPFNGRWCIYEPRANGDGHRPWETPRPWHEAGSGPSRSLDLAIALVERVLPQELYFWSVCMNEAAICRAADDTCAEFGVSAKATTPPLALLTAAVTALIEGEST
jgi:hypothetical protein